MSIFEIYFEYKFGAYTSYIIPKRQLDGPKDAVAHATAYFPSSYLVLHEVFSRLGDECRDGVLVDYGCGMGRTLMFASTLPLKKLIGIELSKSLCDTATANLNRLYRKSKRNRPPWLIVNADARLFEIPHEANIFYFFNPFDEIVIGQVADKIVSSIRHSPRRCIIVYANPVHEIEFTSRGLTEAFVLNNDFAVFEAIPDIRSREITS
jgi:SAM-dependent methyltransferase